ncbi:MAG: MBL fold metallo-hydrolase [Firmicutes bacterium]|nr:MBL fold metallo-hydrolase [Bacillota bacterium]
MFIEVKRLVVGVIVANCYLVYSSGDKEAVVIDPGAEGEKILATAEELGLKLRYIINTHGHADHIGANGYIKERTGADILVHQADAPMLVLADQNLSAWMPQPVMSPAADKLLTANEEICCGELSFKVLATPGHTPGSISLFTPGMVFTGDALFKGSVGRTDFPGGSFTELIAGIRNNLFTLPTDTIVYPGHGPATTIGYEKAHNTFFK